MVDPAVETALEKVRELLRPDGGDIVLADASADGSNLDGTTETSSANGDTASPTALKLRLIVENSDCPECILPVDMLEPIALDIMSADLPSLTSVSIIDPRVADGIADGSSAESTHHV